MSCPCGNPDCLAGQRTIQDAQGESILDLVLPGEKVEKLAKESQPALKAAPATAGVSSNLTFSAAVPKDGPEYSFWLHLIEGLKATGLDLNQYPINTMETIKLVRLARSEARPEEVILQLGMIQGLIEKLKAENRRLEAEVEKLKGESST